MRYPIAMAKVASQECVVQNDSQTKIIDTTSTDSCRGTCTDANRIPCMNAQTCVSTSKDAPKAGACKIV